MITSFALRWLLLVGFLIVVVTTQELRDAGPCNGHGHKLTITKCECDDGWYGEYCSGFDCNDGVWNYDHDNPLCTCNDGWEGVHCRQSNTTTTATPATSADSNRTNSNLTTNSNTIDLSDLHSSPDSTNESKPHTSATLYLGIAIGSAAMCGIVTIIAVMYRSRHRFHHLKQRLLNSRPTPASSPTSTVLMNHPPLMLTTLALPQLQRVAVMLEGATSPSAEP